MMAAEGLTSRTAPVGKALSYAARKAAERAALGLTVPEAATSAAAVGEAVNAELEQPDTATVVPACAPVASSVSGRPVVGKTVSPPPGRSAAVLPGHLPADPGSVAAACTSGGYPELIAGLLERRASMQQVEASLGNAQLISRIGNTLGLQVAAAKAIIGGMSAEVFADVAHTAKAQADAGFVTNPVPRQAPADAAQQAPDVGQIYDQVNGRRAAR